MTIIEFTSYQGRLLLEGLRFDLVVQRMDVSRTSENFRRDYDRLTRLIGQVQAMIDQCEDKP